MKTMLQVGNEANIIERLLLIVWSDLLKQTGIGLSDSFFNFGTDSISVLKLLFRIKQTFHVTLNYREVFDNPTISGLSVVIEAKLRSLSN